LYVCVCADIQLTTEEYRRLEASTLNRLNEIKNRIAAQRSSVFGADFAKELRARQGQEGRFWPLPRQQDGQQQEPEACMGCSRPATVKISKKCETCPERAEVRCTQLNPKPSTFLLGECAPVRRVDLQLCADQRGDVAVCTHTVLLRPQLVPPLSSQVVADKEHDKAGG
jgi:hypothetical protein